MQNAEVYVVEALKNGAMGYILKDTPPVEIIRAILEVSKGRKFLSPSLSEQLIDVLIRKLRQEPYADPYDDLTPREREVFELVANGKTNVQIASQLTISPRTVELHRASMMSKLGLHNQVEIFRYAIKRGVLALDA